MRLPSQKIFVQTYDKVYLINVDDIIKCQSVSNYTIIHTISEEIVSSKTLKKYDELLHKYNFIRIHRSYLINPIHINCIEKKDGKGLLMMSNKIEISISYSKMNDLIKVLRTRLNFSEKLFSAPFYESSSPLKLTMHPDDHTECSESVSTASISKIENIHRLPLKNKHTGDIDAD